MNDTINKSVSKRYLFNTIAITLFLLLFIFNRFYVMGSPYRTTDTESMGKVLCLSMTEKGVWKYTVPPKYRKGILGIYILKLISPSQEQEEKMIKAWSKYDCTVSEITSKTKDTATIILKMTPNKKCSDCKKIPPIQYSVRIYGKNWYVDYENKK